MSDFTLAAVDAALRIARLEKERADKAEAELAELRRRWDELVVAADPSVMENR